MASMPMTPFLIIVAVVSFVVYRFNTRVSPGIPYAGEGSFFSRLLVPVKYGKDPISFLAKAREKLGDVFCVDLFIMKIVFFLGVEGNKAVLKGEEDKVSFWESVKWTFGPQTAATLVFPGWLENSPKTVKIGLLRQERLEAYKSTFHSLHLTKTFFDKWSNEDSVPLFKNMSTLILSHLLVIFMGEDFYRKYADEVIPLMAAYERDMQEPILRILPNSLWGLCAPGRRLNSTHDRFDELVSAEVRDMVDHPEKHAGRSDYISLVVDSYGERFLPVYGVHIMGMLFGGHANAAMTIPWMFLHARKYPGALDKWRAEVIASENAPSSATVSETRPFLEACQRETTRLYTHVSLFRRVVQDVDILGHRVGKGTMVVCSPAATQRDASLFPNPNTWDPTRWLAEPDAYSTHFQKASFVQFGIGQHACPGEKLAKVLIFDEVFGTWMKDYDVEVVSELDPSVGVDGVGAEAAWTEENFGTPFVRGNDVQIRVRKRDTEVV